LSGLHNPGSVVGSESLREPVLGTPRCAHNHWWYEGGGNRVGPLEEGERLRKDRTSPCERRRRRASGRPPNPPEKSGRVKRETETDNGLPGALTRLRKPSQL
jgi:hypothetical protein